MITGSEPDLIAEAWWLLYAAERDQRVSRLLDRLVEELRARICILGEDKPDRVIPLGDQLRLLARMSHRYAAGERCHPAAGWMLAAIHRLTEDGRHLRAA